MKIRGGRICKEGIRQLLVYRRKRPEQMSGRKTIRRGTRAGEAVAELFGAARVAPPRSQHAPLRELLIDQRHLG